VEAAHRGIHEKRHQELFIKVHGTKGKLIVREPGRALQNLLRVTSFQEALNVIRRLPNYKVEERKNETTNETVEAVSYLITCGKWNKYQGDLSTKRVQRHRARETARETILEERRREEEQKRRDSPKPPSASPFLKSTANSASKSTYKDPLLKPDEIMTGEDWRRMGKAVPKTPPPPTN
jgi:hypothetical protein